MCLKTDTGIFDTLIIVHCFKALHPYGAPVPWCCTGDSVSLTAAMQRRQRLTGSPYEALIRPLIIVIAAEKGVAVTFGTGFDL